MKLTGNEPVMPIDGYYSFDAIKNDKTGLTIRQQFASLQMAAITQGLFACCRNGEAHGWSDEEIAKLALSQTNALIAELNK